MAPSFLAGLLILNLPLRKKYFHFHCLVVDRWPGERDVINSHRDGPESSIVSERAPSVRLRLKKAFKVPIPKIHSENFTNYSSQFCTNV